MSNMAPPEPIVKYETAPTLSLNDPDCAACCVRVESDGDGYRCPTCGTTWPYNAGDGDEGQLFEVWSGETLDLPITDQDDAWRVTIRADRDRRNLAFAQMSGRSKVPVAA